MHTSASSWLEESLLRQHLSGDDGTSLKQSKCLLPVLCGEQKTNLLLCVILFQILSNANYKTLPKI